VRSNGMDSLRLGSVPARFREDRGESLNTIEFGWKGSCPRSAHSWPGGGKRSRIRTPNGNRPIGVESGVTIDDWPMRTG
jgi:hypothetical protein